MKKGFAWFLAVLIAVTGLGSIVPATVAQDEEDECTLHYAEAEGLIVERQAALESGNVVLAISLIRQARDLVAGCVPEEEQDVLDYGLTNTDILPVVTDRDGIPMVGVAPGCFMMGSEDGRSDEQPLHEVCFYSTYAIDQTEVTRAMYAECVAAGACTLTVASEVATADDQPINRVTWVQADTYCKWRGLQLPTEAEWEYAARGPEGWRYPWGNEFDTDNLAFALTTDVPAPVGSHPHGASWVGALDMVGNVAEWVRTVYHPYPYNPAYNRGLDDMDSPRVVRGGSYYWALSDYLTTTRREHQEPTFEQELIGFRCADVPPLRPEHATVETTCPQRIELALSVIDIEAPLLLDSWALANLWTDLSYDLLDPCAGNMTWTPRVELFNDDIEMAFVPTGCFDMGQNGGSNDEEKPAHEVCLDAAYWIDKTEVTRASYEQCVAEGVCTPTESNQYSTRAEQPINMVTYFQAEAYCEWRGARLPTEAEWEYAARGPEDRLYPWGDTFAPINVVYATEGEMADVGSKPAGTSWVGAVDMVGNAGEWVSSLFLDYPYFAPAAEQPDDTESARVVRGGSFYNFDAATVSATYRNRAQPDSAQYTNGFRCARDG